MGVIGLHSFITRNKSIYLETVDTTTTPIHVVIDGCAFYFSYANELASKCAELVYCSEVIERNILSFLTYLDMHNIIVDCVCDDCLFDSDKEKEIDRRCNQVHNNFAKYWNSYLKYTPSGYLPSATNALIVSAFKKHYGDDFEFHSCGLDPDREIAKYCLKYDALAVTNDSDFFVFPVKGVLELSTCLENWHASPFVSYISNEKIRTFHNISQEQMIFTAIVQGNDFVERSSLGRDVSFSRQTFPMVFQFVKSKKLVTRDEHADFYEQFNKQNKKETYLKIAEKYDLALYPDYPLSFIGTNIKRLNKDYYIEKYLYYVEALKAKGVEVLSNLVINKVLLYPILISPTSCDDFHAKMHVYRRKLYDFIFDRNNEEIDMENDESDQDDSEIQDHPLPQLQKWLSVLSKSEEERLTIMADFVFVNIDVLKACPPDKRYHICVFQMLKDCHPCDWSEEYWNEMITTFTLAMTNHDYFHELQKKEKQIVPLDIRRDIILLFQVVSAIFACVDMTFEYFRIPNDCSQFIEVCPFCVEYLWRIRHDQLTKHMYMEWLEKDYLNNALYYNYINDS